MTVPAETRSERSPAERAFPLRSPSTGNAEERPGTRRFQMRNAPWSVWDDRIRWVLFFLAILATGYVFLF